MDKFYQLKEQGLHCLVLDGALVEAGFHRFPGDLWAEVLQGSGFTCHRPCPPPVPPPDGSSLLDGVEAKPRQTREPRLKDALFTIEKYVAGRPEAKPYRWPERMREPWVGKWHAHQLAESEDDDEEEEEHALCEEADY